MRQRRLAGNTISVDLDKTLTGPYEWPNIGEPDGKMIGLVKGWLDEGYKVMVHTARPAEHYKRIRKFLVDNGLEDCELITDKPNAVVFIDDRAVNPTNMSAEDIDKKMRELDWANKKKKSHNIPCVSQPALFDPYFRILRRHALKLAAPPEETVQEYRPVEELGEEFIGGRPPWPSWSQYEAEHRPETGTKLLEVRQQYLKIVDEWKKDDSEYRKDKLKRLKEEVLKRLPNQIYQVVKDIPFRQGGKRLNKSGWYDVNKNIMFINNYYLTDEVVDTSMQKLLYIMGHEYWHAFEFKSLMAEQFAKELREGVSDELLQTDYDYNDRVRKHLAPWDEWNVGRGAFRYYLDEPLREQLEKGHLTGRAFSEMMADSLGRLVSGEKGVYPMLENAIYQKFADCRMRDLAWQSYQPEQLYPIEEIPGHGMMSGPVSKDDRLQTEIEQMFKKKQLKPRKPGDEQRQRDAEWDYGPVTNVEG